MSPRVFGTFRVNMGFLVYLLPLGFVVGSLLHAEIWYVWLCVILLRLFLSIPFWRYRDRFPAFPDSSGLSSTDDQATAVLPANLTPTA